MLCSPDLHRTGFGQLVAQDLVEDCRNVNPDLRERPMRPKYEPRPDPIGLAFVKVHPVEALQKRAAFVAPLIRRMRGRPGAGASESTSPMEVQPLGTDA